jgi:hypothetical protein
MRVFKNKWFSHWAGKEGISDTALLNAAAEVASGKVAADLGGCLFKKRLPRAGTGKRGGCRVVCGIQKAKYGKNRFSVRIFQERQDQHYREGRSRFKSCCAIFCSNNR